MKVEIELKSGCIGVNGFEIYSYARYEYEDYAWIEYNVYWKMTPLDSFKSLSEAIQYCIND